MGPKFDMLVKLDGDHEELNFTEEHVEHVSKGTCEKTKSQCASQCRFRQRIEDSFSTPEVAMISFLRGSREDEPENEGM